jgi:hypothetical protein
MYGGVRQIFSRYWTVYGGARALLRSPYFHLSAAVLVLTTNFWLRKEWWDQVFSVMPNLLGFTLGGFAVFLGFGDEKFRALLAEPDDEAPEEPTLYLQLCSTFVHFVLVQSLALLCAVIAKGLDFWFPWSEDARRAVDVARAVGGAVGYWIFLYALCTVIAVTMHVFRIAALYEQHKRV